MKNIEGVASKYYSIMLDSTDPAKIAAQFIREIHGINLSTSNFIFLRKMAKTYGSDTLFYAILGSLFATVSNVNRYMNLLNVISLRIFKEKYSEVNLPVLNSKDFERKTTKKSKKKIEREL